MAGLATPDFASAMKTLYLGPLNDQIFRKHVLLNRLQKNSKDVSGNFAYVPLISARNPAVGAREEPSSGTVGPLLPEAGRQTYTSATYKMAHNYGRGSVSGTTMRKSRNDAGAFTKALDAEMAGLMKSLPDDINRQICGDGTGRAGTLDVDQATSTVITFNSADPMSLKVGDRVNASDITAGVGIVPTTVITTVTAITFNSSATQHTVTLSQASGTSLTAADDAFYFGSAATTVAADSSRSQEMNGIQTLVDSLDKGDRLSIKGENGEYVDNDIQLIGGIDREANAFWQSSVKTNPASSGTNRPLTKNLLLESWLTSVAQNGASATQIELYMHPGMWGTLGMIEVGGRVFNDFQETVEMGFSAIKVNGSFAFYDRDLPNNVIFFLSMENIFLLEQEGFQFLDDDGGPVRNVVNRDAWEFAVVKDMQLGMDNGRAHLQLRDLTENMTVEGRLH